MASHADRRNTLSLDSLNFFLADVRDGLGPYLLAVHKWDPASIGVVMTIAGIAGLLTQTPAGALIDRTPYKRAMIGVAALLVTLSCLILPFTSSFSVVALTQALSSIASSVFAPAIAAISLGITGPKAFTRRTGRNETFNHAGNACAALLAGGFAYLFGPIAVFYLMAAMALASVIAISFVSADAIDHDVARGFDANHNRSWSSAFRTCYVTEQQAAAAFRYLLRTVPSGQRSHVATGQSEAFANQYADGDAADLGVHRCSPTGHGTCGAAGGYESG
ncbi:Major facilitator transporter [Pseudomonas syringae pv. cerasicola]|uniref:Major facilitator transporter n=2 Tax=Pseudomonas syringae group TaxID=136849 RepID=A0A0N8R622_PSESX|nr:Major facilitator transporter [Pseudomonas syringae pv. cerasicola]RMS70790.1 Major facilitator transporter [Pseudomonas savastanoi]RMS74175.1 Major facilitator transporter [Pseudomonas savastanoi]RMT41856.1 Major facilitator transporter [Pseudomonas savastanoi]SOS16588.1 MFS transporter [Pseudomonas syringae pv. cerasicola]